MSRPKRKAIPVRPRHEIVARQGGVCICGSGLPVSAERDGTTDYDHEPALILRDVNEDGTDYVPPQLDPQYIDARNRTCRCHKIKTSGSGATTAGTDIGKWKKEQKRARRASKPKRHWPSGRKLKGKTKWPKRPMRRG